VAQPRGHAGSREEDARRLRLDRAMRNTRHIGRRHHHRRLPQGGAPANPDGIQARSVPHPLSAQPQTASAAALPRAEAEPLAPLHAVGEDLRFSRLSRLAWATLYQRVFDIDPLECSSCGGRMRFVEVIEDIARAPAQPPPLSRARSPDWLSRPQPARCPTLTAAHGLVYFEFGQLGSIEIPRSPVTLASVHLAPPLLANRHQERRLLAARRPLVPAASSELLTLEAPKWVGFSEQDHVPALGAHRIRRAHHFFLRREPLAIKLPLGQRGGLLCVRGRDNEPSGRASNSATSDENQGDTERSSVHRACVTRALVRVKGLD
jgi:hypothetical protein